MPLKFSFTWSLRPAANPVSRPAPVRLVRLIWPARLTRLLALAVLVTLAVCGLHGCASGTNSPGTEAGLTVQGAAQLNPAGVLRSLEEGNRRFAAGELRHPRQNAARRTETALQSQKPAALVLGCSDSRVPVELVFDQGLGDVFVVRVAGNSPLPGVMGSIDYAVGHLDVPLVLVLGHTNCGAVRSALKGEKTSGSLAWLLAPVRDSVAEARRIAAARVKAGLPVDTGADLTGQAGAGSADRAGIGSAGQAALGLAARAKDSGKSAHTGGEAVLAADDGNADLEYLAVKVHVERGMQSVYANSPELAERVRDGSLILAGGIYDLESGRVTWIEWPGPRPRVCFPKERFGDD